MLAEIATAMRDAGVSIESFIQRGTDEEDGVVIVLVTHEGPARAIHAALAILAGDALLTQAFILLSGRNYM